MDAVQPNSVSQEPYSVGVIPPFDPYLGQVTEFLQRRSYTMESIHNAARASIRNYIKKYMADLKRDAQSSHI